MLRVRACCRHCDRPGLYFLPLISSWSPGIWWLFLSLSQRTAWHCRGCRTAEYKDNRSQRFQPFMFTGFDQFCTSLYSPGDKRHAHARPITLQTTGCCIRQAGGRAPLRAAVQIRQL